MSVENVASSRAALMGMSLVTLTGLLSSQGGTRVMRSVRQVRSPDAFFFTHSLAPTHMRPPVAWRSSDSSGLIKTCMHVSSQARCVWRLALTVRRLNSQSGPPASPMCCRRCLSRSAIMSRFLGNELPVLGFVCVEGVLPRKCSGCRSLVSAPRRPVSALQRPWPRTLRPGVSLGAEFYASGYLKS